MLPPGWSLQHTASRRGDALSPVEAVSGLLPLWLPDLPPERLPRLLSALQDPQCSLDYIFI